jgi:hypothetical protein
MAILALAEMQQKITVVPRLLHWLRALATSGKNQGA